MPRRPGPTAARLFRLALAACPPAFRSRFGDEAERAFRAGVAAAGRRGRAAALAYTLASLADVLRAGWTRDRRPAAAAGAREPRSPMALMRAFVADVRYALRIFRRQPTHTAVIVVTIALGLGAATGMFAVLDAVALRPLPYRDPSRVVMIWNHWTGQPRGGLSNAELLDFRERLSTLVVGAFAMPFASVTGGAEPERLPVALVTAEVFEAAGVEPMIGSTFGRAHEAPGAEPVAVLDYGFWQRRFGGDPGVLGSSVSVDDVPRRIVGVMPASFRLPFSLGAVQPAQVYLPLTLDEGMPRGYRGGHFLAGFGRLRDGVTLEAARTEVDAVTASLIAEYPDAGAHNVGNYGVTLLPVRDQLLDAIRPVLTLLSAAVVFLVLITCANVATLLQARADARRWELAVRGALGAGRGRLVRQLVTEGLVLALAAGLASAGPAVWLVEALAAAYPGTLPRLQSVSLGPIVFAFAFAAATGCGLLFALVPALRAAGARLAPALRAGGRGAGSPGGHRFGRGLMVVQVALAVVLVVGAGLFVKSFARLRAVPPGFDPSRVLTFRVSLPEARYRDRAAIVAFHDRLAARLAALPGVRSVGAASGLPLVFASGDWDFDIEGRAPAPGRSHVGAADWYVVTPGYFETLGVPLVAGRLPAASDTVAAPGVIFVNEAFARTYWPGERAVGRRMKLSTGERPWLRVAGVVGDVRFGSLDQPAGPEMFVPLPQFRHFAAGTEMRTLSFVARAAGPPAALASGALAALRAVDPDLPASDLQSMVEAVDRSVSDRRLQALLLATFAGLALLVAGAGLYGVLGCFVAERVPEIGVRLAFGAARADVVVLVARRGLGPVAAGLVAGLAAAVVLGRLVESLLYEVRATDPWVLAAATAGLVVFAVAACAVPVRRAARIDPLVALRQE